MAGNAAASAGSVEDAGGEAPAAAVPAPIPAIVSVREEDDHFLVTDASGASYPVLKDGLRPDTIEFLKGMAHAEEQKLPQEWRATKGDAWITDRDLTPEEKAAVDAKLAPGQTATVVDRDITPEEKAHVDAQMAAMQMPLYQPQVPVPAPVVPRETIQSFSDGGVAKKRPAVDAGLPEWVPLTFGAPDPGAPVAPFGAPIQPPALPEMSAGQLPSTETTVLQDLFAVPAAMVGATGRYLQENTPADSPGGRLLAKVGLAPPPGGEFDPVSGHRLPPPPSDPTGSQTHPPGGLATPQQQAQPSFTLPGYGGTGQVGELNKGLAEQRAAIAEQASIAKLQAEETAKVAAAHAEQLQAMQTAYQEEVALNQRRADDLFMAVANGKVDPNRVWANADVGQRIGAGIGILLSGLGQGLAGGPNLALQQIDRTIERDIAAQKDNLDRQQNLLGYYLQRGRDMSTAHQLAKADLKDMLAAQLSTVAAKYGGQEAGARAQLLMGQLRTEAAGKRQEMMARDFAMKQQAMAAQAEMQQRLLLAQFEMGPRTAAGGRHMPPEAVGLYPEKQQEQFVKLPDGSMGRIPDAKVRDRYTRAMQTVGEVRSALTQYMALTESGHTVIHPTDRGDAQTLQTSLIMKMKQLYELGALQEHELKQMEKLIPDITAVFSLNSTSKAKLNRLNEDLWGKINSNLKSMVIY